MKRIIFVSYFAFIIFSCKKEKENSFQNEGVITGIDRRECISLDSCPSVCGGLLFQFTDTTYSDNIPLDNPEIFNLPPTKSFLCM